jgi:hypothetical protein
MDFLKHKHEGMEAAYITVITELRNGRDDILLW